MAVDSDMYLLCRWFKCFIQKKMYQTQQRAKSFGWVVSLSTSFSGRTCALLSSTTVLVCVVAVVFALIVVFSLLFLQYLVVFRENNLTLDGRRGYYYFSKAFFFVAPLYSIHILFVKSCSSLFPIILFLFISYPLLIVPVLDQVFFTTNKTKAIGVCPRS